MSLRILAGLVVAGAYLLASLASGPVQACCPAGPLGKPVVNADQTVILIWDAATKMEHFIRQASFKSDADDFGFLVPSPTEPDLEESGNEAFSYLRKLTEPEIQRRTISSNAKFAAGAANEDVNVLQTKLVAGFRAVVLETKSTAALVNWLRENGYSFSVDVEAWAKPYVDRGWKITALKVAKEKDSKKEKNVAASALRISFKTEKPLFPYREPDPRSYAAALGAGHRTLRIYFLAEARYEGALTPEVPWTGTTAWAGKIKAEDRKKVLAELKLPQTTGPADWWLTEFEDNWPYKLAPADVSFSRSARQEDVRRPPIVVYQAAPVSGEDPDDVNRPFWATMMIYTTVGVLGLVAVLVVIVVYLRQQSKV